VAPKRDRIASKNMVQRPEIKGPVNDVERAFPIGLVSTDRCQLPVAQVRRHDQDPVALVERAARKFSNPSMVT
jgi:hypothetical protein